MRIYDLIFKKREGQPLNQEEIAFFVSSFTKGEIPDYQASAFLMAAFIRGLNGKETSLLTQAM
ncbi:MAG: pyrimidine-nucleoside phosphorylase, partial [Elusimicrobia bacterium]|nr:pyrimidine-nucleoside phosphorylase [Elusimicrobiota bacterium]